MRKQNIDIITLDSSDIDLVSFMLARIFIRNSSTLYMFNGEPLDLRYWAWFLGTNILYCLNHGVVYTTPHLNGIAAWLPSKTYGSVWLIFSKRINTRSLENRIAAILAFIFHDLSRGTDTKTMCTGKLLLPLRPSVWIYSTGKKESDAPWLLQSLQRLTLKNHRVASKQKPIWQSGFN